MRTSETLLLASWVVIGTLAHAPAAAQEQAQGTVPCRDLPCAVQVDWTREGGVASQLPDRRYGNPTQFEALIRARLTERGFTRLEGGDGQGLRILLVPDVGNAMCDEMAGTATDMSCKAILQVEARAIGPDDLRREVDLPSRIRNRCPSDKVMPVDQLSAFVADWIVYALEGKAKGERRPVARC